MVTQSANRSEMDTDNTRDDVLACLRDRNSRHPSGMRATPAQFAVHNNFKNSVLTLKRSLVRSIFYLKIIKDRRIYKALGYKTILEYAAREAGLGRKQCEAFLSLGRKLGDLPRIAASLEAGQLTWRQAQEICRVADPENEATWVEAAAGLNVRELEAAVRESRDKTLTRHQDLHIGAEEATDLLPLDTAPTRFPQPVLENRREIDSPAPADTPQYVTFKFTLSQFMLWESWLAQNRQGDTAATKETLLCDSLEAKRGRCRHILRTVIHICPECDTAILPTSRGDYAAPRALVEKARCDGEVQHVDGRLTRIIPPRMRRMILARDGHRCRAAGCLHTQYLQMHHIQPSCAGGETRPENLITLCSRCHRTLHNGERELHELLKRAP